MAQSCHYIHVMKCHYMSLLFIITIDLVPPGISSSLQVLPQGELRNRQRNLLAPGLWRPRKCAQLPRQMKLLFNSHIPLLQLSRNTAEHSRSSISSFCASFHDILSSARATKTTGQDGDTARSTSKQLQSCESFLLTGGVDLLTKYPVDLAGKN